jgi:Lrp/AsnC family transcriptional regulator for asnA, asnC and gidA
MFKLDSLDAAIVGLLMEDGRMSCVEIARKIGGVSERSVRYRIDRLVKHGVVRVSAIPNPQALGYGVVADVWLEVEPGRILDVARLMAQYDCVSYVACSTGEHDVSIQVVARDNAELYAFVTGVIGKVPGVRKTTTLLVPLVLKDVYEWHIPRGCATDEKG